jgi:tetratricopeptide (TPR) repeat protein
MKSRFFRFGSLGVVAAVAGCASATPQGNKDAIHDAVTGTEAGQRVSVPPGTPEPPTQAAPAPSAEDARAAARRIFNGANDYFTAKIWDTALTEYQKAVALDPTYDKAYFKIALCFYNMGKYDLEIEYYKRALQFNPRYTEARLNLAHAELSTDLLEDAVKDYRKVLELEPRHPVAEYNLGLLYLDLQQPELAAVYLRHYLQDNPDGIDVKKARHHLDRALEKSKGK